MLEFWKLINRIYDPEYMSNTIRTKLGVLEKVFESIDFVPSTIYVTAFNPIVDLLADHYQVYMPADQIVLTTNPKIKVAPQGVRFDCVLALDEYLTYYTDEQQQKDALAKLADLCDGWLITTLVDYKNLAPYKKNQVEIIHDYKSDAIFLEQNTPVAADKQTWNSYFYSITDHSTLESLGPVPRRTIYFKQLAKYSRDLGSTNYIIQKNTLYRGFGRKHWEHIITIRF